MSVNTYLGILNENRPVSVRNTKDYKMVNSVIFNILTCQIDLRMINLTTFKEWCNAKNK